MNESPNVVPPYLINSENPDQKTFSPQDDMYQNLDTQKYGNWIRSKNSPPTDPELEEIDEENVEKNGYDNTYYDEPYHNARGANTDSEIEDDTNTLPSISSLVKKAYFFCSAVKTASNLSSSQNNGIYILNLIQWIFHLFLLT